MAGIADHISTEIALRRAGLLNTIQPIAPSISAIIRSVGEIILSLLSRSLWVKRRPRREGRRWRARHSQARAARRRYARRARASPCAAATACDSGSPLV